MTIGLKEGFKKAVSLFLSVCIILGLVNIRVYGAEANLPEVTVAYEGEGVTANDETGITGSKTIKKVKGEKDIFDITLTATANKTIVENKISSNVVLVLDLSGSMYNHGKGLREASKVFAENFLKDSNGRLGIVAYTGNSRVISNLVGKEELNNLKKTIDNISINYNGGTNIQSGIRLAQEILTNNHIEGTEDIIVLMSDGVPTFSYKIAGKARVDNPNSLLGFKYLGSEDGAKDFWCDYSDRGIIGNGGQDALPTFSPNNATLALYKPDGSPWTSANGKVIYKDLPLDRNLNPITKGNTSALNSTATIWEASRIKALGTEIYGVLYNTKDKSATEVMEAITSNGEYEAPSNASGLANAFNKISVEITSNNRPTTIIDPMSDYVEFKSIIDNNKGVEIPSAENGQTLIWDLSKAEPVSEATENGTTTETYSLTYRIKVKQNQDFYNGIKENTLNSSVPTNGKATIAYKLDSENKELELISPRVTSTLPKLSYSIEYYKKDKKNGEYTLTYSEKGSGVFGDIISPPAGYEDKYLGDNYTLANGTTTMTIGLGENIIRLYYDPILADVVVRHYLAKGTRTDNGIVVTPPVLMDTKNYNSNIYKGDTFTNVEFLEGLKPVESLNIDGKTYTSDSYTNVPLDTNHKEINLYYEKIVEGRTIVPYEVNYYYRTNNYQLTENPDGTKTLKLIKGEYVKNDGDRLTGTSWLNTSYTVPKKEISGYTLDRIEYNGADNNKNFEIKLSNNNAIDVYYEKDNPKEAVKARLTVSHRYYDITVNGRVPSKDENGALYDHSSKDREEVYVGEVYYGVPEILKDFTMTTKPSDLIREIKEGDNLITIVYERDRRSPVNVTVNHFYRAYKEVVNPLSGEISTVLDDEAVKPMDFSINLPDKYEGELFKPDTIPLGFKLNLESSDYLERALSSGGNVFNLYYDKITTVDEVADITVNHIYRLYSTYVNEEGRVIENEAKVYEAEAEATYFGRYGEIFNSAIKERDGFTFNEDDSGKLPISLVTKGGEIKLYYDKYINDLGEKTKVEVIPIFKTTSEYIDDEGNIALATSVENGEAIGLGDFYIGQRAIANPDDYNKQDFIYDGLDEDNTFINIQGNNVNGVNVKGSDIIKIVYKKTIPLKRVPVQIRNFYEYTLRTVKDGKINEEVTNMDTLEVYNPAMVIGRSINTKDLGRGEFINTAYDLVKAPDEVVVLNDGLITDGVINLDFYWKRVEDRTEASIKVIHHYTIKDLDPRVSDINKTIEDEELKGYLSNTRFTPAINTDNGVFTREEVISTQPKAVLEDGAILKEGLNTIHIFYEKINDSRIPSTITVKHNYYAKNNAIYGDKTIKEFIEAEGVKPEFGKIITIPSYNDKGELITYFGMTYTAKEEFKYNLGDKEYVGVRFSAKPENLTITVDKEASNNEIAINYIREYTPNQASVTVNHRYYIINTKTGIRKPQASLDKTITETGLTNKDIWVGNSYEARLIEVDGYVSASTLEARRITSLSPNGNSITLEYEKKYTPSSYIPDDDEDNTIPSSGGDIKPSTPSDEKEPLDKLVEIDEPNVPLNKEEKLEETKIPLDVIPIPNIPKEEVPIEIIENNIPLTNIPKTGDSLFLYIGGLITSGIGLLILSLKGRKKLKRK